MFGGPASERGLILLRRRDAEVASQLLTEADFVVRICADQAELVGEVKSGAGFVVLSEEVATQTGVLEHVGEWIKAQPSWSDLPIIMLTARVDAPSRNRAAAALQKRFGNITFLERPFHPTTLVSLASTALRSRRRQYEAQALLERYELLARELQHRTKNLLSVILSIASASLREGGGGGDALIARLHSLAKAQDLIFEGGGDGALLEHIVRRVIDSLGARVSIEGPPIFLSARAAQGFALTIHELATNAIKYGSLTVPTGKVSICWCLDAAALEPTVTLTWQEHGGPPATAPRHRGFGTLLLEKAVASPGNPPRFDYAPEGFTYQVTAAYR